MDIQDMRIFARVAAVQNLSAVGTELGLTPGTISKRIQSLEDELSARLFDRTTRSIRITEEGAAFLAHVERILSEIEAARAIVDDKVTKPKGKLKIAAPACLGRRYVAPALCEFVRAFPEIDVQADLHDRQVNLQEDGYDVAIRTGALSDSSLIAKRLAPDRHVIAAAPSYLTRAGCPLAPRSEEHTSELQSHVNLVCRLLLEKKKIHFFIDEIVEKQNGERIWLLATWNILDALAQAGLSKGLSRLFASDSLVSTGCGAKGAFVPYDG